MERACKDVRNEHFSLPHNTWTWYYCT